MYKKKASGNGLQATGYRLSNVKNLTPLNKHQKKYSHILNSLNHNIMKTTAKKLTTFGNIGLVQIRVEPETNFAFKPGAPEMQKGGLTISEASGEGVVGKLIAVNETNSYLLLTDADVLIGAKQNRILDKSMLLSPMSKTVLDVSCIERLRWRYAEKNFSNPDTVADPDLRKEKAASIAFKKTNPEEFRMDTQGIVWTHVNNKMREKGFEDKTESYTELITFCMAKGKEKFPHCEPEKSCNGLAVVLERKVAWIDIFGTEEVYKHYFPKLRDSAFRMVNSGKEIIPVETNEAFFKVLDTLDNYEMAKRHPETAYNGAGSFNILESCDFVGFDLRVEGELIHNALFLK
jgi:hypothetical protein